MSKKSLTEKAKDALASVMGSDDEPVKAESISEPEDRSSGRSPKETTSLDGAGQADFIPGTRRYDYTYIPERVFDEDEQRTRRCALFQEYHYLWVEVSPNKVAEHKAKGYRFARYSGGPGSALAERGFLGTGLFEQVQPGDRVVNGDTVLMWCDMRRYEQFCQEERDYADKLEGLYLNKFHNQGYESGVKTFQEKDGSRLSN